MTPGAILAACRDAGVTLAEQDGRLLATTRGTMDPALAAELRARKPEVLEHLRVTSHVDQACHDAPGITAEQFAALLSAEDRTDIAAGLVPLESLRCYAVSFAAGIRTGRIRFHPATGALLEHGVVDPEVAA